MIRKSKCSHNKNKCNREHSHIGLPTMIKLIELISELYRYIDRWYTPIGEVRWKVDYKNDRRRTQYTVFFFCHFCIYIAEWNMTEH